MRIARLVPLLLACLPALAPAQGSQRTFVVLADSIPMPVPAAASAVAAALTRQGFTVLADHAVGADRGRCRYAARVLVAVLPARTTALLARGAQAAFAVPVRVGIFEDERGVHASMVNPRSLDRTIAAESGLEASGDRLVADVGSVVVGATHGKRASHSYGQSRDRGLIGKTMGVMAGGPFTRQVETIATYPTTDLKRVADDIWRKLQQPARGTWLLRGVYRLDLDAQGMVILGVSGAPMEAKAFEIVGAGDDDARAGFACPGLAHAPAFPIELVIRRDGGQLRVEAIGAMFRMKMYFEDAGRMKFARNMGMPGSIAEELRAAVVGRPS
ncbi:MAG TPA: hypothetical protein VGD77_12130 [Gemmatimonadaceae bacterium]